MRHRVPGKVGIEILLFAWSREGIFPGIDPLRGICLRFALHARWNRIALFGGEQPRHLIFGEGGDKTRILSGLPVDRPVDGILALCVPVGVFQGTEKTESLRGTGVRLRLFIPPRAVPVVMGY